MLLLIFLSLVNHVLSQECFDDGNEFCINQDDILSIDLLPGSFLFLDQYENISKSRTDEEEIADGSFVKAMEEMYFHRQRMNEYLCHGYIAEEIFKGVASARVKRRPGPSSTKNFEDFLDDDNVTIHDKLLSDEGSSKYKDWLQRTTTLDDVYRHYAPHKKLKKKQGFEEETFEEFDGEVTGFAVQAPLPTTKVGYYEPSDDDMLSSSTGHHPGYGPPPHSSDHFSPHDFPLIQHDEVYVPAHPYEHEEEYHKPFYHGKGKGHELSIRDFFEIALTALAFLSFGLFIIQLLMNATNGNTVTVMTDTTRTRFRRNVNGIPSLSYGGNEELNELSHRVLRSIEAALVADIDSGNCLRRMLCEDNQYSKETGDGRRIWIPVWSLGMSWVSGRVLNVNPWSAMLDSVKASVLGLGGANCALLYSNCDLWKQRVKRRRRRRK
ncbi:uncharacterized protein [Prorops nasuta]|uniref:uncharacterized protein n=1 Tax=Prorops nasuta TaxID=863751 RepID=UPI0034CF6861